MKDEHTIVNLLAKVSEQEKEIAINNIVINDGEELIQNLSAVVSEQSKRITDLTTQNEHYVALLSDYKTQDTERIKALEEALREAYDSHLENEPEYFPKAKIEAILSPKP